MFLDFYLCQIGCLASGSTAQMSDLKFFCGQFITYGHEPGHIRCNGVQMEYAICALIIEIEKCPFFSCGACFTDLFTNLTQQDSIQHSVSVRLCSVLEGHMYPKGPIFIMWSMAMVAWPTLNERWIIHMGLDQCIKCLMTIK